MIIAAVLMTAAVMTSCSSSRNLEETNYRAQLEQRIAQLEAEAAKAEVETPAPQAEVTKAETYVEVKSEAPTPKAELKVAKAETPAPKAEVKVAKAEAPASKALTKTEMSSAKEIIINDDFSADYSGEGERRGAAILGAKYYVTTVEAFNTDGSSVDGKKRVWTEKRVTGPYIGLGAEYFTLGGQGSFGPAAFLGISFPYFFIEGDWSMGRSDWHKERSVNTGSYTSMKAGVKAGFRIDLSPKGLYKEALVFSLGGGYLWHINKAEEANGDLGEVWADTWGGCPDGFIQIESLVVPKAGLRIFARFSMGPAKDFTFDGGDKVMVTRTNIGITWTPSKTHDSAFKKAVERQLSRNANDRINAARAAKYRR